MCNFSLRPIEQSDMMTIFKWSNDPETRKQSFNVASISIEEHKAWFEHKLLAISTNQCFFYIFEKEKRPIGSIRLDPADGAESGYIISYMINPSQRGLGYGTQIIKSLIKLLDEGFTIKKPISLLAYVKPTNEASINCLKKCGFEETSISTSEILFTLCIS